MTNRKDFAAFGDEVLSAQRVGGQNGNGYSTMQPEVRKDYTGYEKDQETGLEYAQARYYNNVQGRFTGVDPLTASATIRNPQTFNRYSYVLNSPYKFTDPLGLMAEGGDGSSHHKKNKCDKSGCVINGHFYSNEELQAAYEQQHPHPNRPKPPPPAASQTRTSQSNYPANPNAPAPGSTAFTAPTFEQLQGSANGGDPVADAALHVLASNAQATYNGFSVYDRAVFLNTMAAIADAGLDLVGVTFGGFYHGNKSDAPSFGVVLNGVTNDNLDSAGLGNSKVGRRSPESVHIASLEATTNYGGIPGQVAFDVDLYNAKSEFRRHQKEVRFNSVHGFTTQPADVSRALEARHVHSGVTTP